MLWRLSVAQVVEDGPFSRLPGIMRNLTVISGPGFDLIGGVTLRADPLRPVAFDGGLAVAAADVTAPCADFNVMTAAVLPLPVVQVMQDAVADLPGIVSVHALAPLRLNGQPMNRGDLVVHAGRMDIRGGPAIVVAIDIRGVLK
jgi:hypothetical protein